MFDLEFWVALIFPTVISLFFLGFSLWKGLNHLNSIAHVILTIINAVLNGFALIVFYQMILGAWPTFLPHLMVILSIPFVITQWKIKGL